MRKMFLSECRRGLLSARFLLAVSLTAALWLLSAADLFQQMRYTGEADALAEYLGYAQVAPSMDLLPLLALIPYATAFAEDMKNKSYIYRVQRSSFAVYQGVKGLCSFLCAGITLVCGYTLFLLLVTLLTCNASAHKELLNFEHYLTQFVQNEQWVPYFLFYGWLQFLYGGLWGSVALAISTRTSDRSILYACPLLLSGLIDIIANQLGLPGLYGIAIGLATNYDGTFWSTLLLLSGELLLPTLLCQGLYFLLVKRRLTHE